MVIKKVVSGGQTGADRAGLDAAIDAGILHGGWCPAGRKASDGSIPERYQLQETESSAYPPRTELNVEDSDGTLIFCRKSRLSPGVRLTRSLCIKHGKSYKLVYVDILDKEYYRDGEPVVDWLLRLWAENNRIETLNVAGSRESKVPGIYALTHEAISRLILGKSGENRSSPVNK